MMFSHIQFLIIVLKVPVLYMTLPSVYFILSAHRAREGHCLKLNETWHQTILLVHSTDNVKTTENDHHTKPEEYVPQTYLLTNDYF